MTRCCWQLRSPAIANASIDITLSPRVLLFALGVSLLTGALFGLAPALQAFRTDLASILKDASSSMRRPNRQMSWRNVLVVGQVTLSLVVLIGSGLFLRSLSRIQQTDPGFDVYGVVGYSVAQRHREIGIRMALGARRWEVIAMVLGEEGKIVALGLLLGWMGAVAGSRLVSGLLYGIHGADATTYFASALLLALVALLTSFLATRRGTRVDPVQALKS